ncbi:hypothetical protein BN2475_120208 [Paraburkholderia ribeironis]|uniref:Uncharacterized protein n=1 Tax=Paraburkholderia ribeironis TaxID=1247936 RepID=A0A1N7RRL6_9BURK|nr:hypothetical protein BN2475_120208 [Paraburkholderia ribeironis]
MAGRKKTHANAWVFLWPQNRMIEAPHTDPPECRRKQSGGACVHEHEHARNSA